MRVLLDGVFFDVREGTTDWNTVYACVVENEYDLHDFAGKLVFDIGAHIGGVAVMAATCGARVVAVEAIPENADRIRLNLALNDVDGHVLTGAAGPEGIDLVVRYAWEGDESLQAHAYIGSVVPASDPVVVPCNEVPVRRYSLAELVAAYGVPDILKLDCEGGEWAMFLEDAILDVPLIVGEWHGVDGKNRDTVAALLDMTHDVSFSGPQDGPGGFRAERR